MRRIVYASRAVQDFDDAELMKLLIRARAVNAEHQVTGMLVYAEHSFLQLFEGEPEQVEIVWDRIRMDPRHSELRVLFDGQATMRLFEDWTMGFAHPDAGDLEEELPGYRASIDYPFVSSQLVAGADAAETLLTLYSRRS